MGLFGTSAFEETRDLCDILERVAPNVSELHLFRDDVEEVSMARKSPSMFIFISPPPSFQSCFTSSHLGRSV